MTDQVPKIKQINTKRVLTVALMRECYNESARSPYQEEIRFWKTIRSDVRSGKLIPACNRRLSDAFASICQDLGIFDEEYQYWFDKFFAR